MSNLEIIAVLLGLANIILIVRRSLWNYPFGLAMVTLYFFIFYDSRLYSDALLQIFFFVAQVYGWWNWLRGREGDGELIVRRATPLQFAVVLVALAIATAAWGWLMHRFTDAAFPWWDAAVAMTSVAAQILMAKRYFENWLLWVAVDALAVGLYATRGLTLTAGLYTVFLLIAIWGWVEWIRVARAQKAAVLLPA